MDYELIDIHAHINFNAFKDDGHEVIHRSHDGGVGMILVGSQSDTSKRAVAYANHYPGGVWAAVGLHPIHLIELTVDEQELGGGAPGFVTRVETFDYNLYRKLGKEKKVVAVGECGLDYFRLTVSADIKKKQEEVLKQHIALARELNKPLMIHCRNAYGDLLAILKSEQAANTGGDIHFFVGNWETAKRFLDMGFYLSFTGVITFTSDYDEVVKKIPLERIMIETDSPYVSPIPHRGKRNEPLYVKEVAKRIADIRGIAYEKVAQATAENAKELFKLS
ncbi:MAG: hypothetical protein A3C80_02135 [Candidatus Ryanbacteria bacterium RIFCSPHIGHO2_02_FULL_45_43]|uniref:Hydrolase TatD n=1 Tax=Candidatus Ryanbacteria bacterium RIFCSPHIGHO2_01_45_13 TaxID=1802112 RepID=A0A1G2FX61_9BACT|nr:MAG: hypothetical protein A2718_00565 [Candidatus Ryanbacteria bacterium RIFCSPHIGHO2_01_FULL_44_130]OGZ42407.1 MAG: hypothetical protein A2W41_03410 [Candidatus Ryanbacteria bacterium RIFCSPHIGHO2_01_45_13]OGZ48425.1 MAG: hypothetical protein A3C80_02135 [Candidatus Ryanbacteria bacterium RIFCSPHIGHO2_02_FULL_45_43]OGZ50289.1 MAG: hypothetical protein A3E55_00035 [Candidatus Ryanbacteria bacterium RIFCSPHIGHO2_12_FULL_44_20]OGZ51629.1 MAG: hypothetical protein A3A17_02485 [Candidatus Ryanba